MKKEKFAVLALIFILIATVFISLWSPFSFAHVVASSLEQEKLEIEFFYSKICPHCAAEERFLAEIEKKYPQAKINRYLASDPNYQELLRELAKKHNAERYLGSVPLTFVGEDFFLGFDNEKGIGKKIEESLQRQIQGEKKPPGNNNGKINLPFVGEIDPGHYSLPVLAVLLGILDGFNVCSLAALVLILGLVLSLRSRKKVLIFGGIFILTTAIVYGLLIFLWYQLFSFFSSFLRTIELLIGILGILGGIYFLKEFIRFKKQVPICNSGTGHQIAGKFSAKLQTAFKKSGNILTVAGIVLLFAFMLTVVEFPCSAAVPVVFAGIVANANLPSFLYLFYIAFFLVFYMADEIIVFLIALFTMKLWLSSHRFMTWITFVEAIVLFLLGFYYLFGALLLKF